MKTTEEIKQKLEYLRGELRAERISTGELLELADLKDHIEPGDVELLEAAGVPEFPERWEIIDWMGKRIQPGKEFASFEDARQAIDIIADAEAWEKFPDDEKAREELANGICEDLYAEVIK